MMGGTGSQATITWADLAAIRKECVAAHLGWPFLVHINVILLSVGFSALVEIVFGLFPAGKATRLEPIEASRFE
jgi:putative ABC transport system permease protein